MRNAENIGEMGTNQAFVLVLTWINFALVLIQFVISFIDGRHLLVLSPINGKGKIKAN